jgi:proline iminopeptidase
MQQQSRENIQEGYIPVTGGLVWYQIVNPGKGIPLLTLHGGPGSPHDYLEPLTALADERSVIFYDQLGCGRSERPDDPALWQRSRFVEELEQVRQALNLGHVHLFGHSWGSMLAVDYALTQPQGLASLILASPALSMSRWISDAERYRKNLPPEVEAILTEQERQGTTDSEEYQRASMAFYERHLCRLHPWPEPLQRTLDGEGTPVYQAMWGPAEFFVTGNLLDYDCTASLGMLTLPTLFTCGRYDEASPETTRWYHHHLPQSALAIFEQSAHMPHLEETESYLQVIRTFLRGSEQLD